MMLIQDRAAAPRSKIDSPIEIWMSEDQIVALYRDARYRSTEVRVLAELNGCSPQTIKMILKKHGYTTAQAPKCYGDDRLTTEQLKAAKAMRRDGATYRLISEKLGVPMWAVRYYLNKSKMIQGE